MVEETKKTGLENITEFDKEVIKLALEFMGDYRAKQGLNNTAKMYYKTNQKIELCK